MTAGQPPIGGRTRVAGIIGHPVAHTLSPRMHNAEFARLGLDWVYVAWPVEPSRLREAVRGLAALGVAGFNVTVPHKQAVMPLLDRVSPEARMIGAVNTVRVRDGLMEGFNTDAPGWRDDVERDVALSGRSVFVIGAGGAARAVVAGALMAGAARVTIGARRVEAAGELAGAAQAEMPRAHLLPVDLASPEAVTAFAGCDVVVNTTPVGMESHPGCPVPEDWILPHHHVYDTIYAPVRTELLRLAGERGAGTRNGLGMLARQGALAFEIWTGVKPDAERMERLLLGGE